MKKQKKCYMMEEIESGEDDVDFVLVFKLSRFGRNVADVLNSLQTMQDYGVNFSKKLKRDTFYMRRYLYRKEWNLLPERL